MLPRGPVPGPDYQWFYLTSMPSGNPLRPEMTHWIRIWRPYSSHLYSTTRTPCRQISPDRIAKKLSKQRGPWRPQTSSKKGMTSTMREETSTRIITFYSQMRPHWKRKSFTQFSRYQCNNLGLSNSVSLPWTRLSSITMWPRTARKIAVISTVVSIIPSSRGTPYISVLRAVVKIFISQMITNMDRVVPSSIVGEGPRVNRPFWI